MDKDQDLLAGLKEGKEEARREFFNRHCKPLFRHLCFKARCHEDAQDILYDAFFRAFRDIHAFEGRATLKTWLYRIAGHATVDFYRYRKRDPYLTSSKATVDEDSPALSSRIAKDPGQLAEVTEREKQENIEECLRRLSGEHRTVISLRLIEGLSVKETAQIMGKTEAAVKMLCLRAITNLKGIVKDHPFFQEGGDRL